MTKLKVHRFEKDQTQGIPEEKNDPHKGSLPFQMSSSSFKFLG